MKIAILGSGPAGLLAAHGAWFSGFKHNEIDIITKNDKPSDLLGAQYLHRYIPALSLNDHFIIDYQLHGTLEEYSNKVYGKDHDTNNTSPAKYLGQQKAWDIRDCYNKLIKIYYDRFLIINVSNDIIPRMIEDYDFVVSTIPRKIICGNIKHNFEFREVWAISDRQDIVVAPPENTVICNGSEDVGWYRNASIQGRQTVEWAKKPPIENVIKIKKPIETNCDCFPDVVFAGRYGSWKKGELSHHAFERVQEHLMPKTEIGQDNGHD